MSDKTNEVVSAKHHAFKMGWHRSRYRLNHATRRQARKAKAANCFEDFVAGWYLQRLTKLLSIG